MMTTHGPTWHALPAVPLLALLIVMSQVGAQGSKREKSPGQSVKLSGIIAAFLVDSGVRTRALAWSTGGDLPVLWESPGPVPTKDPYVQGKGLTKLKTGRLRGIVGAHTVPMQLTLYGVDMGLARVSIGLDMKDFTREQLEEALKADGVTLQSLKCSRTIESASYGNLLDAVQVPGKTASGLWWNWNCARAGCRLALTILYRKAEAKEVECLSS
jgi:hypothetical protein